jgi:prevent-host-death family protein
MEDAPVNIHDAKTSLSRLIARVEKGEEITLARSGKPVARLIPLGKRRRARVPANDPLLNLEVEGFDGPGSPLTNRESDRLVYGA